MKKAYIVLAHHKPEQVGRLIESLDDGRSEFFVHVDRAGDRSPFKQELAKRGCCRFIKREYGGWGEVGIVKATLHGLRSVIASGQEFEIVSLISGQDYPLRSNAYIDRFFEANRGKIFMEFHEVPVKHWPNQGLDRIFDYHVGDRRRRSRQKASKWISAILSASVLFKRRLPTGLKPFGGPQWWSLPTDAVNEILYFVKRRPDFLRYHRWSLLPDEMFFQSILLNSESPRIVENLVNNCLRFVDWDNPNPWTPTTITEKYFDALIASRSLFARKFDLARDVVIFDRLDIYRAEEEDYIKRLSRGSAGALDLARSADYPLSPASTGPKIGLFEKLA